MHLRRILLPRVIHRNRRRLSTEVTFKEAQTGKIIGEICNLVNPVKPKFLFRELTKYSRHYHEDTCIDITKLMNKYNITSEELFFAMYHASRSFGSFDNQIKNGIFTVDQAKEILQNHNYHINYYEGKPIKNSFRRSSKGTQKIQIDKFDDRTFCGCFYKCILEILDYKLAQLQL